MLLILMFLFFYSFSYFFPTHELARFSPYPHSSPWNARVPGRAVTCSGNPVHLIPRTRLRNFQTTADGNRCAAVRSRRPEILQVHSAKNSLLSIENTTVRVWKISSYLDPLIFSIHSNNLEHLSLILSNLSSL